MASELKITKTFLLANGSTYVTGKFIGPERKLNGQRAKLVNESGDVVQEVTLIGEVFVRGKTSHEDERVFEMADRISISATQAESGAWRLVIDDSAPAPKEQALE